MCIDYNGINWVLAQEKLKLAQHNILQAFKANDLKLVLSLQHKLVRSFGARALAVKKVTSNKGKLIPGIDNVVITKNKEKINLINLCKDLSQYKCKPIKLVYVLEKNGKKRPLNILTVFDKVVQTLYLFALEPIAHEINCINNYGYIKNKSIKDAATYLWLNLASINNSRRLIYKADIENFFNSVSHNWLLNNIPMNARILKEFLTAKVLYLDKTVEITTGFPQGSPISPILANMALAGLQKKLSDYITVRYVDDFLVLFKKESEKLDIAKKINEFLAPRNLILNKTKSSVFTIEQGFEFLGLNFREYPDKTRLKGKKQGIFLIKPAKDKILDFLKNLTVLVKAHKNSATVKPLIMKLNQNLRGFGQYYRYFTSKKVFSFIGYKLFYIIFAMLTRKHRRIGKKKIYKHYFTKINNRANIFCYRTKQNKVNLTLFLLDKVKIIRHTISAPFNPFDKKNWDLDKKTTKRLTKSIFLNTGTKTALFRRQNGHCPVCEQPLLNDFNDMALEIHHVTPQRFKGNHRYKNLKLLHKDCHNQVENTTDKPLKAVFFNKKLLKTFDDESPVR